ncbi:MAG: exopolysaccharide biosynthesis protein [Alphaproteobacteria bacterium]|nr:exopolysaccharide biosynthesis protein [Alphaproteobacteria bacterium]
MEHESLSRVQDTKRRIYVQGKREIDMTAHLPKPEPAADGETTSALLRRILASLPNKQVSIGYLVLRLRRRSFGGLIILLAALGLLPGISFFCGFAMIVPGVQMTAGYRAPLLPRFIRRRRIGRAGLTAVARRAIPLLERLERFVKPRWLVWTRPPVPAAIGVLVVGLALVVMLPLPFSNLPPAIALLCLSLGLLERDGLLIVAGVLAALVSLAIGALISYAAFEGISFVIRERL